jgi:hypothetical protein
MLGAIVVLKSRCKQLVELEKRFTRREAELQRALDESKQANKVELSRLHAIHQVPMRRCVPSRVCFMRTHSQSSWRRTVS